MEEKSPLPKMSVQGQMPAYIIFLPLQDTFVSVNNKKTKTQTTNVCQIYPQGGSSLEGNVSGKSHGPRNRNKDKTSFSIALF
jgi:hypothetical protein